MSEQPWAAEQPDRALPSIFPPIPPAPPKRRWPWVWAVLGVVLVVLAGAVVWLAIDTSSGEPPVQRAEETRVTQVKTIDGHSALDLPVDWRELPEDYRGENAVLTYGQVFQERYLMVLTDEKADFSDFADYEDTAILLMAEMPFDTPKVGQPTPVRIGTREAVRYEVSGVFEGEPCVFWFTLVNGERRYHQVITWTLESRRGSAAPALEKVAATFREI
ncbi:hypothetical protein [Actinokineospora diospyrosa]|uniref:Alanine and proline-rich secreted protein Apa n=1 Tax=Actinokineospora diospyrosa TaxID=103728 RepID=A0ABT1IDN8_9PSEU|nr:hypothetical protein [Actinokineospora diospyrosa]MCP2270664.1 hypothetical protein [Actinokineospora diospyrosa]